MRNVKSILFVMLFCSSSLTYAINAFDLNKLGTTPESKMWYECFFASNYWYEKFFEEPYLEQSYVDRNNPRAKDYFQKSAVAYRELMIDYYQYYLKPKASRKEISDVMEQVYQGRVKSNEVFGLALKVGKGWEDLEACAESAPKNQQDREVLMKKMLQRIEAESKVVHIELTEASAEIIAYRMRKTFENPVINLSVARGAVSEMLRGGFSQDDKKLLKAFTQEEQVQVKLASKNISVDIAPLDKEAIELFSIFSNTPNLNELWLSSSDSMRNILHLASVGGAAQNRVLQFVSSKLYNQAIKPDGLEKSLRPDLVKARKQFSSLSEEYQRFGDELLQAAVTTVTNHFKEKDGTVIPENYFDEIKK